MDENKQGQEQEQEERTFTQAELDAIVGDRLKRDRAKYADYDSLKEKAQKYDEQVEASKSELQKATDRAQALETELNRLKKDTEVRNIRQAIAEETGVPASLLSGDTDEECRAQASKILEFAKPGGYPSVPDGGEIPHSAGKKSTRQVFAEWAEKAF